MLCAASALPSRPNSPTSISDAANTERMPIPDTGEFDAPISPAI